MPPVVFASPATTELVPVPIPRDWIIEGTPQARSARLATSADGTSSVIAWSCSAGRFNWRYAVDETLHIISGEVFVTNEKDEVRRLAPGDMVFFPAGSRSTWYVPHEVRKLAFCRHSMPRPCGYALRAWNKLVGIVTGNTAAPLEPQREPVVTSAAGRVKAA
ncbi:MAG TPA: cupin domain-containing protein [Xanthobacteraceae bacterium]|nr:cupin domain-containing protein [Xanthobacteraceae bacterium]